MENTVIGVFESQTQIDLLKDSLNNDGIPDIPQVKNAIKIFM